MIPVRSRRRTGYMIHRCCSARELEYYGTHLHFLHTNHTAYWGDSQHQIWERLYETFIKVKKKSRINMRCFKPISAVLSAIRASI